MIEVKVDNLMLAGDSVLLLLKGINDIRSLPVIIGPTEAQSIYYWIEHVNMPRPMTHDLIKNLLDCLETRVKRVEITEIKEHTFYAQIILESEGTTFSVDSRPSDAVALALRTDAHIFVAAAVMEEAGKVLEIKNGSLREASKLKELQEKLQKAVSSEEYELAASIRDKIKTIKDSQRKN